MKLNLHEQRLIALARLHHDGISSFGAQLGYSRGNFSLITSGRRAMPTSTASALVLMLGFKAEGFSDRRLQSWLMRSVSDMDLLLGLGFEFTPLTLLVSARDQAAERDPTKKGAQYQFLIGRVSFMGTDREVVLRASKENMAAFLMKYPPASPLHHLLFDYGKRSLLYAIDEEIGQPVGASQAPGPAKAFVTEKDTKSLEHRVTRWLESDTRKVSSKVSSMQGDGLVSRTGRRRLYIQTMRKIFGITRHPKRAGGHALRGDGETVLVEINPVFFGEPGDMVYPQEDPKAHTVVVLEHDKGIIEILFEGPLSVLFPAADHPSGTGRFVSIDEFRALNRRVEEGKRLMLPQKKEEAAGTP